MLLFCVKGDVMSCLGLQNSWCQSDGLITGLFRSQCEEIDCIELAHFNEMEKKECTIENWSENLFFPGWIKCPSGKAMGGIFRSSDDVIDQCECCAGVSINESEDDCYKHDISLSFDLDSWTDCKPGYAINGIEISKNDDFKNQFKTLYCCKIIEVTSNKQPHPSTLPSFVPTLSTPTHNPSTHPNDNQHTTQPLLQYIVNNENTNGCDPVTQIEATEEQCKEIADSNAIWSWRFTWKSKSSPSGCYLKDLQFIYYNYHENGESAAERQPICYKNPAPCECLGMKNGQGYGDVCGNHEPDEQPYCYVDKNACTEEDIEWFESSSIFIDTTSVAYSYELCQSGCIYRRLGGLAIEEGRGMLGFQAMGSVIDAAIACDNTENCKSFSHCESLFYLYDKAFQGNEKINSFRTDCETYYEDCTAISNRCGTTWADANSRCGTACEIKNDSCPSGETCYADMTVACTDDITGSPSLEPPIHEFTKFSTQSIFSAPYISPSIFSTSNAPSSPIIPSTSPDVPSIFPSQFPTMDCSQILDQDICRHSFCAWSQLLEQCNNHCEILDDVAMTGVKIGGEIVNTIGEVEDCEKLCLEEKNCKRFSYNSHQICSLFSSFETLYSQHGTQTGICLHMLEKFEQTLATTNRPIKSLTRECGAFFDKNSCRQSQCAWLVHESRCSHTCPLMYDIAMVGERIRDPVNGGYFKAQNIEECEILCLKHKNCLRFSYSINVCSLFKNYQKFFQQHGVVTGICVHTEIPTKVPTHLPTYIPTHRPSLFPTKLPSKLPTSEPEVTSINNLVIPENSESNKDSEQQKLQFLVIFQKWQEEPALSETRLFYFMIFSFLLLLLIIACYAIYRCYEKNQSKTIVVDNVMEIMPPPLSAFVVRDQEIHVVAVLEEFKFEKEEETLTLHPCSNTLEGSKCPELEGSCSNSQGYLNEANLPRTEVHIPITLEGVEVTCHYTMS